MKNGTMYVENFKITKKRKKEKKKTKTKKFAY